MAQWLQVGDCLFGFVRIYPCVGVAAIYDRLILCIGALLVCLRERERERELESKNKIKN